MERRWKTFCGNSRESNGTLPTRFSAARDKNERTVQLTAVSYVLPCIGSPPASCGSILITPRATPRFGEGDLPICRFVARRSDAYEEEISDHPDSPMVAADTSAQGD